MYISNVRSLYWIIKVVISQKGKKEGRKGGREKGREGGRE